MTYFSGQSVPAHKDTIMIHCLATSVEWGQARNAAQMMRDVTLWHTMPKPRGRGWRAVGYASIIDYDGGFALGRDLDGDGDVLEETAAAARGWNRNAIHLALAGGRHSHEKDAFTEHYTVQQDTTLRAMIAEIQMIAGRTLDVIGHNETAAKACPGFYVPDWYASAPLAEPSRKSDSLLDRFTAWRETAGDAAARKLLTFLEAQS